MTCNRNTNYLLVDVDFKGISIFIQIQSIHYTVTSFATFQNSLCFRMSNLQAAEADVPDHLSISRYKKECSDCKQRS